jgi:hypothetical protein
MRRAIFVIFLAISCLQTLGCGGNGSKASSAPDAAGKNQSDGQPFTSDGSSDSSSAQDAAVLNPDDGQSVAGSGAGASGSAGATAGTGGGSADSSVPPDDSSAGVLDSGPPIEPGDPGAADVTITVRSDTDVRPISPLIYGINGARDLARNRQTVARSGGNRLTAYNWENNASNAGSDWNFQNDNLLSDSDTPGKAITDLIDQDSAAGVATVVTIPIVDYVAADKNGDGDVRNSGANYLNTRFKSNKAVKGSAFTTTPDTNDGFVYEDEFVAFLKGRNSASKIIFSLDNEPDLWSSTHAEVHPDPVTYAELWERNNRFAKAIKDAWAEAEITGFVSYGYNGFVSLQGASDANGRVFIEWYLDQAQAAEKSEGKRLIDYLDLHWYSEAQGGSVRVTESNNSDAVVQAREQAPRSLWDSSYKETSWICDDYLQGPIDLLHWLFDIIDAHYPGTKLAFTEWNYGGGNHISGAIAAADVLGIFGREGVGLAARWPLQDDESFSDAAFRAYRNYDGQGAEFGDTSILADSSDIANVTAYASIQASQPERAVVILINKAQTAKTAALRIAHPSAFTKAQVYVISSASAELVRGADVTASAANAFKLSLAAQSVSVIALQI